MEEGFASEWPMSSADQQTLLLRLLQADVGEYSSTHVSNNMLEDDFFSFETPITAGGFGSDNIDFSQYESHPSPFAQQQSQLAPSSCSVSPSHHEISRGSVHNRVRSYPREMFLWAFYPYQLTPFNPMDEFRVIETGRTLGEISKRSGKKLVAYSPSLYQFLHSPDWDSLFVFRLSETRPRITLEDGSQTLGVERITYQKAYSARTDNCDKYVAIMQELQVHRQCDIKQLLCGKYSTDNVGFCVAYPDGMIHQMYLPTAVTTRSADPQAPINNPLAYLYKFLSWPDGESNLSIDERITRTLQFDSPVVVGTLPDGTLICMLYNMNICGAMIEPFNKIAAQIMAYTCTTEDPLIYLGRQEQYSGQGDLPTNVQPYLKYPTGPVVFFACKIPEFGNPTLLELVPYELKDLLDVLDSFHTAPAQSFPVFGLTNLIRSKMACFHDEGYDPVQFSRFTYELLASGIAEDSCLFSEICALFSSYGDKNPFVSGKYSFYRSCAGNMSIGNPMCAIRSLLSAVISLSLEDHIYFPIQRTREDIWTEHHDFSCNKVLGTYEEALPGKDTSSVPNVCIALPPLRANTRNNVISAAVSPKGFDSKTPLRTSVGSPTGPGQRKLNNSKVPPMFASPSLKKSKDGVPTKKSSPTNYVTRTESAPSVMSIPPIHSPAPAPDPLSVPVPNISIKLPDKIASDIAVEPELEPAQVEVVQVTVPKRLSPEEKRSRTIMELWHMIEEKGKGAVTKETFAPFSSVLPWLIKTWRGNLQPMTAEESEVCKFCVENLALIKGYDPRLAKGTPNQVPSSTPNGVCGKKRPPPPKSQPGKSTSTVPATKVSKPTTNSTLHRKKPVKKQQQQQ